MANGIETSNYRSLSRHARGEKPSLQAIKPAIFILHFHDTKIFNRFITKRDIIIYGYIYLIGWVAVQYHWILDESAVFG